jgi:hypothetical protein
MIDKKKIFLLSYMLLTFAVFANDETYPRVGVIASNTEIASINYSCMSPKDDKINYRTIECEISYQTLKKGEYKNQRKLIEDDFKKNGVPTDMCVLSGKCKQNLISMTTQEIYLQKK